MKLNPSCRLFFILIALLFVAGLLVLPVVRDLRQALRDRALIVAVKRLDDRAVTRLISEGADANAKDPMGLPKDTRPFWRVGWDILWGRHQKVNGALTALQIVFREENVRLGKSKVSPDAQISNDSHIVRTLLEHGANPNVYDQDGHPPLWYALTPWDKGSALLIIQHDAKIFEMEDRIQYPLLPLAAYRSADASVLQAMLDRGADVNKQQGDHTALMWAATYTDAANVRFLLAHHANRTIKDRHGHTALDYAGYSSDGSPLTREAKQIIHMLRNTGDR